MEATTGSARALAYPTPCSHCPPIPHVASADPEVAELIQAEASRQFQKLRMIASENYVSEAVLEGISRALQLDDAERSHLYDLVRAASQGTRPQRRRGRARTRRSL